ncbi:MAG: helix-turn-helix domain-containing protein [Bacillota bacterium]|nr:helix-turn-helix domain-containing protein [Bacillota bacterium]
MDRCQGTAEEGRICPRFRRAAVLLGRRWTAEIIARLLAGPHRFREIRRGVPGLSDRLLSQRLKELEEEGLVVRRVDASARPVQVAYALTDRGRQLVGAVDALHQWAHDWL